MSYLELRDITTPGSDRPVTRYDGPTGGGGPTGYGDGA